jgi:hypothetical protein
MAPGLTPGWGGSPLLLVIACPCALVMAAPVTMVSGLTADGNHRDVNELARSAQQSPERGPRAIACSAVVPSQGGRAECDFGFIRPCRPQIADCDGRQARCLLAAVLMSTYNAKTHDGNPIQTKIRNKSVSNLKAHSSKS